jgi:hypothetical protein
MVTFWGIKVKPFNLSILFLNLTQTQAFLNIGIIAIQGSRLADVNTLGERLSETENTDEMWQIASELKSRGKKGIPGLLYALSSVSV